MAKKLYTTNDIVNLVKEQQLTMLELRKGDLITPMARDTARELGVKIVEVDTSNAPQTQPASLASSGTPASDLESQVRAMVKAMLGQKNDSPQAAAGRPVIHVDGRNLTMPAFPVELHRPEMDVRLEDVITARHGAPMAAGFMSMHKGSFPWTLTYDEIQYVIEGELHIVTAQGVLVGKPGDVLYIPKNTSITFSTPGWAKFLYVTYPAEWSG